MKVTILIDNHDITSQVLKDGYPEWFEESMKGAGYFNFEVRPFVFRVLATPLEAGIQINHSNGSFILERNMSAIVRNRNTGEIILNGFVDGVSDEFTEKPQITLFPYALKLKDCLVGTRKNLNDDDWVEGDPEDEEAEIVADFDTEETKPIREIVQMILNDTNARENTNFTITEESCP